MSGVTSVLFLTSSEHGQSNVVLAVLYELLLSKQVQQVHVASFEPLRQRVLDVQDLASNQARFENHALVKFYPLPGPSMHESMRFEENPPTHKPGYRGAIMQYRRMAGGQGSWNGTQYVTIFKACRKLLIEIKARVVVVGNLFSPAIDACNNIDSDYIYLSAEMLREHRPSNDSLFDTLCRRPATCSGYPTPIPRHLILTNALLYIQLAYHIFVKSSFYRGLMKARKEAGIIGSFPLFVTCSPRVTYLVPSVPQCDFPQKVPNNIVCCGPILLPEMKTEANEILTSWVKSNPTMVVSFGSAYAPDSTYLIQVATALSHVLNQLPRLQVLWKLDALSPVSQDALKILEVHLRAGRVKLEQWIPQVSVLRTGFIACLLHHGGTNSFLEALSYGVPQVILPTWFNTYERAQLAEYLGVGIYASKVSGAAPGCDSNELATALQEVISNKKFTDSASRLKRVANLAGGRTCAAKVIVERAKAKQSGEMEIAAT